MIKIENAHEHAFKNASEITEDGICSCYYCCSTFKGSEIREFIDNDETVLCPVCGIDSVIPEKIDKEMLQEIYEYNFKNERG